MSAKPNRRIFVSDEYTDNLLEKILKDYGYSNSLAIRMGIKLLSERFEKDSKHETVE